MLVGAVGSEFKMAHSRDGAGCWREASVPLHVGFFSGLLMCLHGMAAGSPHIKSFKREQGGSGSAFGTCTAPLGFCDPCG